MTRRLSIGTPALLAGVVVALLISVAAVNGHRNAKAGVMQFCDLVPTDVPYEDVDEAYRLYLDSLEDNGRLRRLVEASHESFRRTAGKSRAKKPFVAEHADRLCMMHNVLVETLDEAKRMRLID